MRLPCMVGGAREKTSPPTPPLESSRARVLKKTLFSGIHGVSFVNNHKKTLLFLISRVYLENGAKRTLIFQEKKSLIEKNVVFGLGKTLLGRVQMNKKQDFDSSGEMNKESKKTKMRSWTLPPQEEKSPDLE